jgi:hypothetical protein
MAEHQFIAEFVKFLCGTRRQNEIVFFRSEPPRERFADAAGRARDERHFHKI